jgi:hypothetical protein
MLHTVLKPGMTRSTKIFSGSSVNNIFYISALLPGKYLFTLEKRKRTTAWSWLLVKKRHEQ